MLPRQVPAVASAAPPAASPSASAAPSSPPPASPAPASALSEGTTRAILGSLLFLELWQDAGPQKEPHQGAILKGYKDIQREKEIETDQSQRRSKQIKRIWRISKTDDLQFAWGQVPHTSGLCSQDFWTHGWMASIYSSGIHIYCNKMQLEQTSKSRKNISSLAAPNESRQPPIDDVPRKRARQSAAESPRAPKPVKTGRNLP